MHILEPHLFTLALLLLLPATSNGADVSQCYFPNGKASPGDVPCDPSGKTPSMCCRQRSDCLSSGFCLWNATNATSGINLSRGSCTDQSWESPFCPQQCLINQDSATNPSAYDLATGGVVVWRCQGQGYAEPGPFCCESDSEGKRCCRTETAVFSVRGATLGNALEVQTLPISVTSFTSRPTSTSSESSSSGTGTETTTTKSSSTVRETGATQSNIREGATTAAPTTSGTAGLGTAGSGTPAAGEAGTGSGGRGGLGDGAKIGIGIGIGIGAALLFAVAFFIWYQKRSRAAAKAAEAPATGPAAGPTEGYYYFAAKSQAESNWVAGNGGHPQELGPDYGLGMAHRPAELPTETAGASPLELYGRRS